LVAQRVSDQAEGSCARGRVSASSKNWGGFDVSIGFAGRPWKSQQPHRGRWHAEEKGDGGDQQRSARVRRGSSEGARVKSTN